LQGLKRCKPPNNSLICKLIIICIADGKRAERIRLSELGKVERIWDQYPYPVKKGVVNLVIGDTVIAPLACAQQEQTRSRYYSNAQVPILWYMTSNSIAAQGQILLDVALKHAAEELDGKLVKVIWIPLSGIISDIQFNRDVLEILDTTQKAKEYGREMNISIELCLAKTWLPLGVSWHEEALAIHRLNTAMETAGYYWLRCRVIDLTVITMHKIEHRTERNMVSIEGLEDMFLVADHYKRPRVGGIEVTYQAGRKAREILRRVLTTFKLEPDWDTVTKSATMFVKIDPPRAFIQGRNRVLPAPVKKVMDPHETLPTRSAIRSGYLRGRIPCDDLPPTGLGDYEWHLMLAQSTIPGHKKDEMTPAILSRVNRMQLTRVRDEPGFVEPTRRSPGGKRKREETRAESSVKTEPFTPNLTITIPNRKHPTGRAKSAHSRLEPVRRSLSRRRGRSHERFENRRNSRNSSSSKPPEKRTRSDNRPTKQEAKDDRSHTRSAGNSPRRRPALKGIETTWVTASEDEDDVVEITKEANQSVEEIKQGDASKSPGSPEQYTSSEDSSSSDEDDGQTLLETMLAKMVEDVKADFRRQLREKKARKKAKKAEKKKKKKEESCLRQ